MTSTASTAVPHAAGRPAAPRRPLGPTLAYVRLEVLRTVRNPRAVLLTTMVPVLLLLTLSGQGDATDRRELLASMAAYGAIGGGLFATGPRLTAERVSGWLRQLRATPLSPSAAVLGKGAAGLLLALISSAIVGAVGHFGNAGISVAQWAELVLALTLCATVTTALGLLIGSSFRSPETAQGATMLSYIGLSAVGGLWVPPSQFPDALQTVAHVLPTYHVGEIARAIATGGTVGAGHCAIIAAWALVLGVAATVAWRRGTAVR
ncbi:ABC transporter permease [Patulibacter sp.]|uniref:ABC transporter permease n=1 Tax=Patulibacter sp. TaxID=1912859 RepID=UPI00271B2050|nr:ABC transporter permease [Patulibacter sp.]MDO9409195.1 ABC transporter permease [Patulibacter sp.]